jgi:hypothetical protein
MSDDFSGLDEDKARRAAGRSNLVFALTLLVLVVGAAALLLLAISTINWDWQFDG